MCIPRYHSCPSIILVAKVALLSHCVEKVAESQRKWPVTGKQESRSSWVTYGPEITEASSECTGRQSETEACFCLLEAYLSVAGRYSALYKVTMTLPVSQMPPTENPKGHDQSSGLPGVNANLQGRETFEGSGLEEAGLQPRVHHTPHHRPFAHAGLVSLSRMSSSLLGYLVMSTLVLLSQRSP